MNKRLLSSLAVAGTLAMTAPMLVHAQAGGGAPDASSPAAAGGAPDASSSGMQKHEMHHGRGMRGGERGGGWMGASAGEERMLRGLDLTEAQRDKVFALRHDQAPKLREQGKIVRDSYRELRKLTMSDNYDAAKAREISERGAQAMAQIAQLRAQTGNEIYKLLTPEQRQKLADRDARGGERAHGERGHGKRGGGDRPERGAAPAQSQS